MESTQIPRSLGRGEATFQNFARSRLTKQTEFVRGDTTSSWTFIHQQEARVAPYDLAAVKPKGFVVLGKGSNIEPAAKPRESRAAEEENKTRTLGCQTSPRRHGGEGQATSTLRTDHGAMRWRVIQASHQRVLQSLQHRNNFIIQDMDASQLMTTSTSTCRRRPPGVASLDGEQKHIRCGNTQKLPIIVTASPEARGKRESPLAFCAALGYPSAPPRTNRSQQDNAKVAGVKKEAEVSAKRRRNEPIARRDCRETIEETCSHENLLLRPN